jgi:poly(hydroxyalkanoate) depolymerase family esterase
MKDQLHPDMLEATRLTRKGRIGEATALLLRMLRTDSPGTDADHGTIIDLEPDAVEETPFEPRPRASSSSQTHARRQRTDVPQGADAPSQRPTLTTLRRFLGRLGRMGASLGTGLRKTADGVPPEGRFITGSYANHAGHRSYKLYIPSGYRGKATPLIVMLHGCTQSPDDFAAGTRMNVLAEENTCLVAYPAQPVSANASKCWNWFSPSHQRRDEGEPSLIAGITRQIMQEYAVDPKRIYIAGLSAGAAAASILAMTYPDLYAAVGVHSGLAPGTASDLASAHLAMQQGKVAASERPENVGVGVGRPIVPTIVFHGDQDTKVHPRNGDHVLGQAGAATRIDLDKKLKHGRVPGGHAYTRTLYLDPSGSTVLEQWIIHGLGHAWSGGAAAGSYTDPRGPDAAREMLRFFLQHTHGTAAGGHPYGL